jgi:hypothetical protein
MRIDDGIVTVDDAKAFGGKTRDFYIVKKVLSNFE